MQQQCVSIYKQHGVKSDYELPEGNIFTAIGKHQKNAELA